MRNTTIATCRSIMSAGFWICLTLIVAGGLGQTMATAQDQQSEAGTDSPDQPGPDDQEQPADTSSGESDSDAEPESESDAPAELDDDELAVEVERRVAQLDAKKLSDRREAEKMLFLLGPRILEFVPKESDLPSAEMRQRLRRIVSRLEKLQSEVSIDATAVTISNAKTLGEALKQITRQTKIKFDGQFNESLPVVIDVKKVPFWTAVDEVLDQALLDVNVYGGLDDTLNLTSRVDERPNRSDSAAYAGVFRVEPMNVISRRDLVNPSVNGLDIMIDVAWELRLTPTSLSFPLEEIKAKLDNGDELELQPSANMPEAIPTPNVPSTQVNLPFQLPVGRPGKIETLTGKIKSSLPASTKTFTFALDSDEYEPAESGKLTVQIDSVVPNGTLHEVRLLAKFEDAGDALDTYRGWIFDNPAYAIENATGDRKEHLGYEMFRQTADEVGIGYLFDFQGDPSNFKLQYESPGAIVENEVTFRLHDIPLP